MIVNFRDMWKKWRTKAAGPALLFAIFFAAIRGIGMLGPQPLRLLLPAGFVMMMILPFVFLTKEGRRQIGLKKSPLPSTYLIGVLFGAAAASVCFAIGILLFAYSPDNWFVTVRNYYLAQVPGAMNMSTQTFFLVATVPALIFSPIGEEIFFRGFLQDAFETRFGLHSSMIVESAIFGFVHLFHHGLARNNGVLTVYPLSGMLWVALMFLTAYGFALLRKRSGSIYPSILAHAVFNLAMNLFIFSFLLNPPE